jgi:hypothetical protein
MMSDCHCAFVDQLYSVTPKINAIVVIRDVLRLCNATIVYMVLCTPCWYAISDLAIIRDLERSVAQRRVMFSSAGMIRPAAYYELRKLAFVTCGVCNDACGIARGHAKEYK